jgi:peptidoglycan-N-acetylglucosamine deacetylase
MQVLISMVLAVTLLGARATAAVECQGNPDALGTSRTVVVDPVEHPRLGRLQYSETLPLKDHEVVLTFDDGPFPPRTNHILRILARECVKATFFMVGLMATTYPSVAREVKAAGHTIGTHSQNHPLQLNKMPLVQARKEIDEGISSVTAALGETGAPAPFFRIPGLARTNAIDKYLATRNLMIWSADFLGDDWTKISPAQVYSRALQRIEARGKGILLLHDVQTKTVEALPALLRELKRRGYHVVHVVPGTPNRAKSAWTLHLFAHAIPLGEANESKPRRRSSWPPAQVSRSRQPFGEADHSLAIHHSPVPLAQDLEICRAFTEWRPRAPTISF